MEGAGYNVVDIGVRQTAEEFIEALEEHDADILGMSAMLTTTMPYMKIVIDEMIHRGIRNKIHHLCRWSTVEYGVRGILRSRCLLRGCQCRCRNGKFSN